MGINRRSSGSLRGFVSLLSLGKHSLSVLSDTDRRGVVSHLRPLVLAKACQ